MPKKERPDIGLTYEESLVSLLLKSREFNILVNSLYSVFNSTNITDLNSYQVRQLKRITQVIDTFISIVTRNKDLISAHCILRCIVDSTVALFLIYDNDNQEIIKLRHYLYILDANNKRNEYVKNLDLSTYPEAKQGKVRTLLESSAANFESTKSLCKSKIKELALYKEKAYDIDHLIVKTKWKFQDMSNHKRRIRWEDLYKNATNVVLPEYTGFLSQDVHNLAFSVENLNSNTRDFIGDIVYASHLCEQLMNFIERRLNKLWIPKVQEYYDKIRSEEFKGQQ